MKKIIAALAIVCFVVTLSACKELGEALAPIAENFRVFTYSYKKLPAGTTLANAKAWMERHNAATRSGSLTYTGNKENNTLFYRLRAVPPAADGAHRGVLMLNIRDQDVTVPGATGALIDVLPLPRVGDTITSADVHIYISEAQSGNPLSGALPVEYQNANNPNSYFKLVLKSLDHTNNKATGWFEGLAQSPSGDIVAVTDGEFVMDITN